MSDSRAKQGNRFRPADWIRRPTIGQVVAKLFELQRVDPDDLADRDFARLLTERFNNTASERQLPLRLTA